MTARAPSGSASFASSIQMKVEDVVLGSVGKAISPSETLDHAVRYLSTWSGSDKLMMTAQYAAKLFIPLLQLRAEQLFRSGKRLKPASPTVEGLFKLAGTLSIARRVSGLWGLLAIIKALSAIERTPPASRLNLTLQRLQGISMIIYYPLEYFSLFSSPFAPILHRVSPATSAKAQLWSIRAWGFYVALQVVQLRNEWVSLSRKERASNRNANKEKSEETALSETDLLKLRRRKEVIACQLLANVSRLPVILHWSVIGGIYKRDIWTNVLSFISAVAALRGGWEGTRLPHPTR